MIRPSQSAAPSGPVLVTPPAGSSGTDMVDFLSAQREALVRQLHASGALPLRGWQIDSVEMLARVASSFAAGAPLVKYAGGASPRKMLGEGSYTSAEYPPELELSLHKELSY